MFKLKAFDAPPKITYKDRNKNEITINVDTGKENKEIRAVVISPLMATAIQKANYSRK